MFSLFKQTKTFKLASPQSKSLNRLLPFLFFLIFISGCGSLFAETKGAFGGDRLLEPRLKKQVEEEKRLERERQRKVFETQQKQREEKRKRYYYGEKEKQKSEEQLEYEENKQYMSPWERLKFSWKNAENIQDIFDISLETTYAPAKVKASFLNIHSGPGRHYPTIYIAEKGEYVDFTAIRTEWYQLRTPDGHFGWAHISSLPEALEFDYEMQGFSDEAKVIATRKMPLDLGFNGGFMADEPMFSAIAKVQNTHFISSELELGISRGGNVRNDYIGLNALVHPLNEMQNRPHFIIGLGQMRTEYAFGANTGSETGLYTKAGLGVIRQLDERMRFRAELAQLSVENPVDSLNHYSVITVGASYIVAGNTDEILNRSIGERVSPSDIEVNIFTGDYNISHGPSASNTGVRVSYHVSEDYFMEIHGSQGSEELQNFGFAIARNFLPAEYVIKWRGKRNFWPSRFYGLIGTGIQKIDEDEQIAVSFGGGISINPLRHFGIRFDARQNIVHEQVVEGVSLSKYPKNPEFSAGLSYYF